MFRGLKVRYGRVYLLFLLEVVRPSDKPGRPEPHLLLQDASHYAANTLSLCLPDNEKTYNNENTYTDISLSLSLYVCVRTHYLKGNCIIFNEKVKFTKLSQHC